MCPKPAAFAEIPDATIDLFAEQHADELAAALGDRATLPILQWDGACDGNVRALMARSLMGHRGYNRQAGTDEEIGKLADRADAFLDRCRPGKAGADGKRENPRFIDSAQNAPRDAIRVTSSRRSDDWARPRRSAR
jgi:hypothetical protein